MNAIIFGRMTTFQLQNMRSSEPEFDSWYADALAGYKEDAIVKFCHDLRTKFEKTSHDPTLVNCEINLGPTAWSAHFSDPPPHAVGMFVGDELGRSGWDIQMPDGSTAQYFVNLPDTVIRYEMVVDVPKCGVMATIDVARHYLNAMGNIVEDAAKRFG